MENKRPAFVILSPGFPENEADTTCLPAQHWSNRFGVADQRAGVGSTRTATALERGEAAPAAGVIGEPWGTDVPAGFRPLRLATLTRHPGGA